MFRWYAEAGECYAYLSDVRRDKSLDSKSGDANDLHKTGRIVTGDNAFIVNIFEVSPKGYQGAPRFQVG